MRTLFAFVFVLVLCTGNVCAQNVERDYAALFENARVITVDEQYTFSGAKHYVISADGVHVGDVNGNFITTFGNKFTFTLVDGTVYGVEKERKRIVKFLQDRSASVFDKNNTLIGIIGDKKLTKFFSIGYTFHFFAPDETEIGLSDETWSLVFKANKFYGYYKQADGSVQKKIDYTVQRTGGWWYEKYDLTVVNRESVIPRLSAMFMVCIEDVIMDSHKDD